MYNISESLEKENVESMFELRLFCKVTQKLYDNYNCNDND